MPPSAKVYVIDDDPAMRDSLDFLLGSAGFNVRIFDSAQAFLNELANLEAGCVVTDVRMPGINGMELLRQLSSGPRKLPVIDHAGESRAYRASKEELTLIAFYADCRHQVTPVRSGYRVTLTFNLLADAETPRPADQRDDATTALTTVLAEQRVWAVRVHDVRASADAVAVVARLQSGGVT